MTKYAPRLNFCIDKTSVIPLRISEAHLQIGDDAIHGEEAYALFYDGQRNLTDSDYNSSRSVADSQSGILIGKSIGLGNGSSKKDEEMALSSDDSGNGKGNNGKLD